MSNYNIDETKQRIKKLQQNIANFQADACIIATPVNLYYLCDYIFDGFLYIQPDGEPIKFIKRPTTIEDENVIFIRKPEQIPDLLAQNGIPFPKNLLIESDVLPYSTTMRLKTAFEGVELLNVSGIMRAIRSIKSEHELSVMRECAKIHASVYQQIPHIYRKGMSDIDFQIELEYVMRKAGSIGIFKAFGENMDIFMGSILAGDNGQAASPFDFALGGEGISPLLPIGANGTKLKPGTTLMVDMAGNYKPVMDDMTRSYAIEYAPDLAYKAHQVSIDINNAISSTAKTGTACSDIYFLAENMAKEAGLEAYFMGTSQQAKFVGHGVGLEINEPPVLAPRSKEILQRGMTIAVEPKFVLPGIGAVGIENTYAVEDHKLEKITLFEESLIILK